MPPDFYRAQLLKHVMTVHQADLTEGEQAAMTLDNLERYHRFLHNCETK